MKIITGAVATRSLEAAAAKHRDNKVLADGMGSRRRMAAQMLEDRTRGSQIQNRDALPQDEGGENIQAPPSDARQPALAAVKIAADLVPTAGFDRPAVRQNLNPFVTAVSGRGMGFCDPELIALALRYANIAARSGVTFDHSLRLARHMVWY